jgi:hypothetical protein
METVCIYQTQSLKKLKSDEGGALWIGFKANSLPETGPERTNPRFMFTTGTLTTGTL